MLQTKIFALKILTKKSDGCFTFGVNCISLAPDLKWTQHVDAVSVNIASRVYFLRQLKRAGATSSDLLCFYFLFCPLSSNRQHYEIDDCLEDNREDY